MTGRIRIRQYISRYHSNSIFFRNLGLILILVAVPLIGLSLFTFRYNRDILDEEIHKSNTRSLVKFGGAMDMIQEETERIAGHMINSSAVIRFTNGYMEAYPDYEQIETMRSIIHDMELMTHNYVNSVYIYSDSNNYLLTPVGGGDLSKWRDLSVHNRMGATVNDWYYDYMYESYRNILGNPEKYLTYYKEIYYQGLEERAGIAAVLLDVAKLETFLFGSNREEREIMFVVDGRRHILFSTEESWLDRPLAEIFPDEVKSLFSSSGPRQISYGDSPYVSSFLRSEKNDWIYATIHSREDYYAKQTRLQQIMIISLIFSLMVSAGAASVISLYVFKPIHEVIGMLEHPSDIHDYENQDNELKFIAGNIMESYGEYQHHREEIQNRAAMLNTARVRALQAQINPHFLNNTLQLVNWTIMKETDNEDSEAMEILENLADLVRVNMETKSNITPLEEEAGYAARYMAIQEKRYGSKIRYVQSIPDDLKNVPVLKMLIQPLVENAIYHGLKKSNRAGVISLMANREYDEAGASLLLTVEDNGVGMDSSDIYKINNTLRTADSLTDSHIGLINVALRLRLVFGPEATMVLSPGSDRGVTVKVTIPLG